MAGMLNEGPGAARQFGLGMGLNGDRRRAMSDQEDQTLRFARDMAANTEKMLKATQLIARTRDEDVNIATTPKHLVMRRDKVESFRYEPMADATARTPV